MQAYIELNNLFLFCFLASDCPPGWDEFDNSCFKVPSFIFSQRLSWENARAVCLGFGGDLVTITNEKEEKLLFSETSIAWIGLNDRLKEGEFVWSDGTPFNSSVYSNWHHNQPDNFGNEDCVEMTSGKWNDRPCSDEKFYICERTKGEVMFKLLWLKLYLALEEAAIPMKTNAATDMKLYWDHYVEFRNQSLLVKTNPFATYAKLPPVHLVRT